MKLVIRLIFLIGCCIFSNGFAAENVSKKLNDLIVKIKDIKQQLSTQQNEKNSLANALKKTELSINSVSSQLRKTDQELNQKNTVLKKLTSNQLKLESDIKKQRAILLKHLKLAYILGLNKNQLQILLTEKDPTRLDRLLRYNQCFSRQHHEMIHHLRKNLHALQINKQTTENCSLQLSHLKDTQLSQQKTLDQNKQKQEHELTNISLQVKTRTEQLNELLKNKKNLENLIARLATHQKKSSEDYLSKHTGKFPPPTEGKVIEKFGSTIQDSELKQNGILIAAPENQKVYAVAAGRVIFSNWLPGYGLLLIIDHGKGYMTLYGNNSTLLKKNHAQVKEHEPISTVGHTGGRQQPALYFALRYNGKAINPDTWLK